MKKIVLTLIFGSALANCNAVGGSGSGAMMLLPFLSSSSDTSTPAVASSAATEGTTFTVVSLDSVTPIAIPVATGSTSSTASTGSTSSATSNSSSTSSSSGTTAGTVTPEINVAEQQAIAVQAVADAEAAAKAAKEAKARKDQEAATQAAIEAQIASQAAAEAAAAIQAKLDQEKAALAEATAKAKAEADAQALAEAEAKEKAAAEAAALAQAAADKAEKAAKEAAAAAAAQTTVQTVTSVTPIPVPQQFTYTTNVTVPVVITIADKSGPVSGVPCTVSETTTSSTPTVLGTGNTNTQGVATISISVPPNVNTVNISAVGNNPTTGEPVVLKGEAPVLVPAAPASTGASTTPVAGSTPSAPATVAVSPTITLNTTNFQPATSCNKTIDTDCDGVLNVFDDFANDASLSQRIRSGRYTIAFEDLWLPDRDSPGDADLNDFVAIFSTEMDQTPDGLVKNLRGIVTLIGKGAGYNHELRLSLNVPSTAQFNQTFVNASGQPWTITANRVTQPGCISAQSTSRIYAPNTSDCRTNVTVSTTELRNGILIMPSSDLTLFGSQNVAANLTRSQFVRGVTSNFSFSFTTPVDLKTAANMVGGHLNWNLVINQGPVGNRHRVYRPGYVTGSKTCTVAGRTVTQLGDRYMDCNGFPWAIIVPGVFNFPNGSNDIRNPARTGYPAFQTWAASKGQSDREWYARVVHPQFVVNVRDFYQDATFSAYMIKAVKSNILAVSFGLIVIGASMGFFLKKKVKPSIA